MGRAGRLEGKVALIGGTRGTGAAHARIRACQDVNIAGVQRFTLAPIRVRRWCIGV
jgi:hypothetical protein